MIFTTADCIEFASNVLDMGFMLKNINPPVQNSYVIGSCDVELTDAIIDTKCSWNIKTLQSNIDGICKDYEWQGRGYLMLYNKPKFILFYGLMDTPEDCNYGNEVTYSHLEDSERWIAYTINRDIELEQKIIDQVIKCRAWLEKYHAEINSKLGKIN